MNLRLFKYKNFAICCFLMILVGGVLNAGTVLEPQFLQELMGYTATLAGQAWQSRPAVPALPPMPPQRQIGDHQ